MGNIAGKGGLGAIIPVILPLITQFLQGRSGNDLASMLSGNQGQITDIIEQLTKGGALGGAKGNLGGVSDPASFMSSVAPMMRNQPPVVVVPEGMKVVFPGSDGIAPIQLEKIDSGVMEDVLNRIAILEANEEDSK